MDRVITEACANVLPSNGYERGRRMFLRQIYVSTIPRNTTSIIYLRLLIPGPMDTRKFEVLAPADSTSPLLEKGVLRHEIQSDIVLAVAVVRSCQKTSTIFPRS